MASGLSTGCLGGAIDRRLKRGYDFTDRDHLWGVRGSVEMPRTRRDQAFLGQQECHEPCGGEKLPLVVQAVALGDRA